nr:ribosome biogenesis GTPase YlqF [Gynuella sunshinyii]
MLIHWFPGHMNKARRQIQEVINKIDVVIEVLDARLPESSRNPLLTKLRADRPVIKVMSKSDLADPGVTEQWLQYFRQQQDVIPLAITTEHPERARQIPELAKRLVPHRGEMGKPVRAMIMGIPNVGKSTLINTLLGRKMVKVGNEPAITKGQQKVMIGDDFQLMDTPGIMSPSPQGEMSGYRLAASGAIRDTALEYDDVAMYLVDYLMQRYPDLLMKRYGLQVLAEDSYQCLAQIAAKRGCLKKGGFDLHKVSDLVVREFRDGKLGSISLEEPGQEIPYRDLEPDPQ